MSALLHVLTGRCPPTTPVPILAPASPAAVATAVQEAAARDWALLLHGGGTLLTLGAAPRRVDAVLDLRRLDRVVEYAPADLTVTVEAGCTVAAVQALLAARRQTLPFDPPCPERATIGGTIATNTAGFRRGLFGALRDHLIGLRVVSAAGETVRSGGRVVKNVAGYDLNKLHLGALGTLGVIVEATFKVLPAPAERQGLWLSAARLTTVAATARAVCQSGLRPEAVLILTAPAVARLGGALPGEGPGLLVVFSGHPAAVARQLTECRTLAGEAGLQAQPLSLETVWPRVRDFGFETAAPVRLRGGFPPATLPQVVAALGEWPALVEAGGTLRALGPDLTTLAALRAWLDPLRAALTGLDGYLVLESAPPALLPALDPETVWGPPGPDVALMARLKAALDPAGRLNPGRFVGGL